MKEWLKHVTLVKSICKRCNKKFEHEFRTTRKRIFCSNKCSAKFKEIRSTSTCQKCFKKFEHFKWNLRLYCSTSCYHQKCILSSEEKHRRRLECFDKHVIKNDIGCWQWNGERNIGGYGRLNTDNYPAHRFSYELYIGSIPEGLYCLHKCDVRDCCRPDHLFLGTLKDNNCDMYAKNRQYQSNNGRHPSAKLINDQVIEIRKLLFNGFPQLKIAKQFNISKSCIYDIKINKTYKDVK